MGKDLKAALLGIVQRSAGFAGYAITGIIGAFIASGIGLIMFIVALYYFFADGSDLLDATEKLIPIHVPYQKELLHRFEITVRSVVLATMLSAVAQGLATAFMLSVFVKTPFFIIFMLATVTSLIPVAGAWIVWGPYALGLLLQDNPAWGSAISMVLIGTLLIGTMDNVIKTYVLQNDIRLHPLLALVSVLGGIQAMGLWGVFIGPIVASCLYALVKIFNVELKELSKDPNINKNNTLFPKSKKKKEKEQSTIEKVETEEKAEPAEPESQVEKKTEEDSEQTKEKNEGS